MKTTGREVLWLVEFSSWGALAIITPALWDLGKTFIHRLRRLRRSQVSSLVEPV